MSLVCGECGSDNATDRRFCGGCGASLNWACAQCDWKNSPVDKFCGGCGNPRGDAQPEAARPEPAPSRRSAIRPIPFRPISQTDRLLVDSPELSALADTSVQRRQVTALFADLTGYSVLANQLEGEEVHHITNRYRTMVDEIIESYDGIVPRHFGDAVLGLFGYPTAHTNDPERAVRTALEIHAEMEGLNKELGHDLQVHIGIASGTALVDSSGRQLELTGRAIILGSRLYDLAEPGQTFIADTTYRAVNHVVECVEIGERSLKGFDSPARVWRLDGLIENTGAAYASPMVGRTHELGQIRSSLETCRVVKRGNTTLIRGEAGIGKSRLMSEAMDIGRSLDFRCYSTQVLDFGSVSGQDPVRMLVRGLIGLSAKSSPTADTISDQISPLGIDVNLIPHLNHLLDVKQSAEAAAAVEALDYLTRQRQQYDLVCQLVAGRARIYPLLIIIEDVHWADQPLIEQIDALAEVARGHPVVLLLSTRIDGDPFADGHLNAFMTTMPLDNLATEDLRVLAQQLETQGGKVLELCVVKSGGNPLFLEQLLRSKDDLIEETLPGSITSIVQSRVDQLEDRDRLALQAASVLGQHFDGEIVQILIESKSYSLDSLIGNHLIRRERDGFAFSHALIREGVYAALLTDVREGMHSRAAKWYEHLDTALWAQHLKLASSNRAADAFLVAAREKASQYRYDLSLSLAQEGIEIASELDDKVKLRLLEGEINQAIGEIPKAIATLTDILSLTEDPTDLCHARIALAGSLRVQDRLDEALDHLRIAEALAEDVGLTEALGRICHQRGNIFFPRGDIDACLDQHERARRIASRVGSPSAEADALSGLGDANYQRGRMETAATHYEKCLDIGRENDLVRVVVANWHMQGLARYYQCRLKDALDDCLSGADYAATIGHQRAEMAARSSVGPIQLDLGKYDEAGRQAELGLEAARQLGAKRFEPLCLTTMARIDAIKGDCEKAIAKLEQALEISRDTGVSFTGPWILGALANLTKDASRRHEMLAEGLQILDKGSLAHCHFWFCRDALEVYQRTEDQRGVLDIQERLTRFTKEEAVPWVSLFLDRAKLCVGLPSSDVAVVEKNISDYGFVLPDNS